MCFRWCTFRNCCRDIVFRDRHYAIEPHFLRDYSLDAKHLRKTCQPEAKADGEQFRIYNIANCSAETCAFHSFPYVVPVPRSEERRVGKERDTRLPCGQRI